MDCLLELLRNPATRRILCQALSLTGAILFVLMKTPSPGRGRSQTLLQPPPWKPHNTNFL